MYAIRSYYALTYYPNSAFSPLPGAPTNDVFSYEVQDSSGNTSNGIITVEVLYNDPPAFAGTNSDESFTGTSADEFIFGGGGIDTLSGGLGNDVVDGGPGNDILTGGGGIVITSYSIHYTKLYDGLFTIDANSGEIALAQNVDDAEVGSYALTA